FKDLESIAIEKISGRGREADHAGVKVLDDLVEAIENRAVGFVEDDKVEKARAELFEAATHGLEGRDVEPLVEVDVSGVDTNTGLAWQVSFETVVQGLFDKRIAVGHEEDLLGGGAAEKDI